MALKVVGNTFLFLASALTKEDPMGNLCTVETATVNASTAEGSRTTFGLGGQGRRFTSKIKRPVS